VKSRTPIGLALLIAISLVAATIGPLRAQVIVKSTETTATYGDWVFECLTPVDPKVGTQKGCTLNQTQNSPIFVAPRVKSDRVILTVFVKEDIWLQAGLSVVSGQTEPLLTMPFLSCVRGQCVAEVDLTPDGVNRLRAQTAPVRMTYKSAAQSEVTIPLSLNGFGDAIDALSKQ
jgi:invasion protein IalB